MKRDLNRCSDKYTAEAIKANAVYLGQADEGYANYYRKYRLLDCSHEINLVPVNVRNQQFNCGVCLQTKLDNEAKAQSLEIISRVSRHVNLYLLPCGCQQAVHTSAVRTGQWMCRQCNESYFDTPNSIYLLEISSKDFSWLKLGYSNNLQVRIRSYKLVDCSITLLKQLPMPTGREAIRIEQKLHSKFFAQRLDPCIMQAYHTQDGYTECYPLVLKETLLSHLEESVLH